MKMTQEGFALIRAFEGFRGEAYRCPAGIWTIGYGHTSQAGPPAVRAGLKISKDVAAQILEQDVKAFADGVRRAVKTELGDQQFAALVSFAYNVGLGNFSASSVLKAVNARDFAAVPRRLQLWNKAGGRVLPGLVRRRAAEAELFVSSGNPLDDAGRDSVTVSQGKPLGRSTTAGAALISVIAGACSTVLAGASSGWGVALGLFGVTLAAGAWIILQRRRKAQEEGI